MNNAIVMHTTLCICIYICIPSCKYLPKHDWFIYLFYRWLCVWGIGVCCYCCHLCLLLLHLLLYHKQTFLTNSLQCGNKFALNRSNYWHQCVVNIFMKTFWLKVIGSWISKTVYAPWFPYAYFTSHKMFLLAQNTLRCITM